MILEGARKIVTFLIEIHMNDAYSNALKNLRDSSSDLQKSFANRLFTHSWEYFTESFAENTSAEKIADPDEKPVESKAKTVTEKVKVLDELHKFGEEQFLKTNKDTIKLDGGAEMVKKSSKALWEPKPIDAEALKEKIFSMSAILGKAKYEIENKELDVLFLCDEELIQAPNVDMLDHNKLGAFYETEVAVLFQKMINAMNLNEKNYSITQIKDGEDSLNLALNEIYLRKPKYVVSLGGVISSRVLKTRDRLQSLRGKFHQFKINLNGSEQTYELLPLFSPSYLNEAPNSKRLAWEDMQKLMEKLA
jgi:hypothetical protein